MKKNLIVKLINLPFLMTLLAIILLNFYLLHSITNQNEKKENIFRLHIVANSNQIEDQIIKLKIEQKVEEYLSSIEFQEDHETREELLKKHSNQLLNIANSTLQIYNKDYSSHLDIGDIYYDEKENIHYHMNSGVYQSARLVLGKGEGKNIWTIIFPNEETAKSISSLDTIFPGISHLYESKTTDKISNEPEVIEYDFKLKEIFHSFKKHLNI